MSREEPLKRKKKEAAAGSEKEKETDSKERVKKQFKEKNWE